MESLDLLLLLTVLVMHYDNSVKMYSGKSPNLCYYFQGKRDMAKYLLELFQEQERKPS